jgi:hypothetical protein
MIYLIYAAGAVASGLVARSVYNHLEHWNRSQKLRGAKACLNAVHDTLESLAKSKPQSKGANSGDIIQK